MPLLSAKRGLDLVLSAAGLVVSWPVWAALAALITLEDGGPIFFTQERVGQNGKPSRALKFRSMRTDAEMATERERMQLIMSVPELWAASLGNITKTLSTMTELSARRVGRAPDDPAVRNVIGAMFGVLLTVALDWGRNPEVDRL